MCRYALLLVEEKSRYITITFNLQYDCTFIGSTSSPGCSKKKNVGLKRAACDGKNEFFEAAAKFVSSNLYVDDGLISVESVN